MVLRRSTSGAFFQSNPVKVIATLANLSDMQLTLLVFALSALLKTRAGVARIVSRDQETQLVIPLLIAVDFKKI